MKTNPLQYDVNFIDVLSSLAPINQQVIVHKDEAKNLLHVTGNTGNTKVYYTVDANASKFDFTGKHFAILLYSKFKQYFSACQVSDKTKIPILETTNDEDGEPISVIIKQPAIGAKIQHTLASIDGIIKPALYDAENDTFLEIGVNEESAKFELAADQLKYIKSMSGTIGATNVRFHVNQGICDITLFNPKTSDIFTQSYPVTCAAGANNFELQITSDVLELLPSSKYDLTLDKDGLFHFHEVREDAIEVNLYVMAEA